MNPMDEPDFQVTDLRTGLPDERVYAHGAERRQRRRRLGAIVTMLALVGVLVAAFVSVPGFGATMRQALHLPTPAPSPTLALAGDIVYFEHGLPWGRLLMDGKLVTNVESEQPYTGFEQLYTSLRIPYGRHQFEYSAPPFPAFTCQISVPASHSDTCPLVHTRGIQDVIPPFPAERVLDLGGDPASLSPDLLATLQSAAARTIAALTSSTTIAAGDRFADAAGKQQVASSNMTATLSYAMATDPKSDYTVPGSAHSCAILCDIQPASYLSDSHALWVVAAHVSPAWAYIQQSGVTIPGSAAPSGILPDSIVPLGVTWNGAWHVGIADSLATSPICFVALNLFAALHLAGAPLSSLKLISAPIPADGCLAAGNAVDVTGVARIPFTVMYRFGLLFAVDSEARQLLPGMRVADARLRALARAWQE
ncbi:MAG TPA: hypothetical protein VGF38_09265 [Ktedonobacterales bacterium]